jgi:hypothetical protein
VEPVEPGAQLVEPLALDQVLDQLVAVLLLAVVLAVRDLHREPVPAQQLLHLDQRTRSLLRLAGRGVDGLDLGLAVLGIVQWLGHGHGARMAEPGLSLGRGARSVSGCRGRCSRPSAWSGKRAL